VIQDKSIIAVIPARGGSKRLPGKNIRLLAGKPLIAWTIEEAQKSKYIDRLIVSTDAEEIAEVAKRYRCEVPFIRPAELASDEASSNDVIKHAINEVGDDYDIVMILQPTSPLRKAEDIDGALEFMQENGGEVLVSICEARKPINWYYSMDENGVLRPCVQKNNIKTSCLYLPNGALFIADIAFYEKINSFYTEKTLGYSMPEERSVDVDTYIDFLFAEMFVK